MSKILLKQYARDKKGNPTENKIGKQRWSSYISCNSGYPFDKGGESQLIL